MPTDATLTVGADPRCVAVARRWVEERWAGVSAGADLDAIKLLVSELVTNVIRHSPTGEGQMRVQLAPRTVRVEVRDEGDGPPATLGTPDRGGGGGFGLHVVDCLADRWGVQAGSGVWFEMDVERARSGSQAAAVSG